jgi:nucleotide-binding universal stress UspA family protein
MNMWKKLLVPHDFSPCAEHALRLAVELAKTQSAELVLMHVSELPGNLPPDTLITPSDAGGPIRIDDYTTRGALQELEERAEPLRREGFVVQTRAVTGRAPEEILAAARDVGADALVVGTHGRKGLSHLLLGSVTERLVREAPVPVISVRSTAEEAEPTNEETTLEDELQG